jgi:hypothetical protein
VIDDFRVKGVESTFSVNWVVEGGDIDEDGLTNGEELAGGTDPLVPDSDADGLSDGAETDTEVFVSAEDTGSSPLNSDSDGGGESDGLEVAAARDPNDDRDDLVEIDLFLFVIDSAEGLAWTSIGTGDLFLNRADILVGLAFLLLGESPYFPGRAFMTAAGQGMVLEPDEFFDQAPVTRRIFVHPTEPWMRWHDSVPGTTRSFSTSCRRSRASTGGVLSRARMEI